MDIINIICLLLVEVVLLFNCSSSIRGGNQVSVNLREDRRSPEELLEGAKNLIVEGNPIEKIKEGFELVERAELLQNKESFETCLLKVKAAFYISDYSQNKFLIISWAKRGQELAKRLIDYASNRVEGYYYYAVFTGLLVQAEPVGGLSIVPEIKEYAERAIKIDKSFDDGGPLRLLGMLYIKAPPWPTSIGDVDLGIELLEEAVNISSYPLNKLFLAEAYIHQGEGIEKAKMLLREVLEAPPVGRWKYTGKRWRNYAKRLLYNLRNINQKISLPN